MGSQTYAESLWDVLSGQYPPPYLREIPIVTSLFFYSLTIFSGRIMRLFNKHYVPQKIQLYVGDLVTSFMMCACSLENSHIKVHYGWLGYSAALFCLGMWYSQTVAPYRGNPCGNVIEYMQNKSTLRRTVMRTVCQLIGGLLSYRYARSFWSLELTDFHGERLRAIHCTSDLNVPSVVGFSVETFGSFFDTLLAITTFTPFFMAEMMSKSAIGVILTCFGVGLTGFYVNPVNASNQTFGCRGTGTLEHVLIYWVGPLGAAACGVTFKRLLVETFGTITKDGSPDTVHREKETCSSNEFHEKGTKPANNSGANGKTAENGHHYSSSIHKSFEDKRILRSHSRTSKSNSPPKKKSVSPSKSNGTEKGKGSKDKVKGKAKQL